jgi:pSer/pThr/pTyr-binding forkhead associated (FHA) protein
VVFDLGSRTGTVVDGKSVEARKLATGDIIKMGASELVFTHVEAAG